MERIVMIDNGKQYAESQETPPLASESTAIRLGLAGCMFPLAAVIVGFAGGSDDAAGVLTSIRVALSVLGMIIAGSAITLRSGSAGVWFAAAATCLIARFGIPNSWDTFRLVSSAFFGVAAGGGVFVLLPYSYRMGVGAGLALLHFSGIFFAVTSPQPAPLLTSYLWTVIYRPYLQFVYLNNAYQFYSPDPGPASELWFCIYYGTHHDDPVKMEVLKQGPNGEPIRDTSGQLIYEPMVDSRGELAGESIYDASGKFTFQEKRDAQGNVLKRPVYLDPDEQTKPDYLRTVRWVKLPRRSQDYKDPLGQSYYRRLSLSEQVVHTTSLTDLPVNVQGELTKRRQNVIGEFPLDLKDGLGSQCQVPSADVVEIVFPAYVRHIAWRYERPDRPIESMRVYRVTHRITPPDGLIGNPADETNQYGIALNDPTTYVPYYMGQFNTAGELIDPADPMLYWMVPIRRNPSAKPEEFSSRPRRQPMKLSEYNRLYEDFVYKHAGSHHMEGELKE